MILKVLRRFPRVKSFRFITWWELQILFRESSQTPRLFSDLLFYLFTSFFPPTTLLKYKICEIFLRRKLQPKERGKFLGKRNQVRLHIPQIIIMCFTFSFFVVHSSFEIHGRDKRKKVRTTRSYWIFPWNFHTVKDPGNFHFRLINLHFTLIANTRNWRGKQVGWIHFNSLWRKLNFVKEEEERGKEIR